VAKPSILPARRHSVAPLAIANETHALITDRRST